jgi:serine/threonine protein kinase
MLAGERPFQGESIATIMFQITQSAPPPVTDFVPKLPPIFQKLIEKALAKDAAQRFQTGAEMATTLKTLKERLEKALAQAGKPAAVPPRPPPGGTAPQQSKSSVAAATQQVKAQVSAATQQVRAPAGGSSTQRFEAPTDSAEG